MFDNIFAAIEKWMRELLSGMVESNLSTMFTAVNQQTSEIAAQVGQTPQGWNSSIFSMIRNISDSVVIPIAGIIITLILCYELISMLTERNNLHDVDTWMFFKYFVKIDAFGNVSMETYTYQEEVEYEYKILNVLLKNKGFDTIARKNMNQKQTGRYDAYNLTYGNRPELFGAGSPTYSGGTTGSIGTGGAGGSGGGFKYDIPSEALSDEKFARMIEEAEKYLGMPYVWGGSSPSTSFDCSGFVCWVINNSGNGWSVGRTTANGLRGKCSYVSPADAQPGDLIFFEKTYNTVGASHVGIYVGNGMMIHCGDPISYTSINSTYWQSHFLGFGRIN